MRISDWSSDVCSSDLFPGRIHVQQRERRRRGVESLFRKMQHNGAVLADRIEHDRLFRLCDDVAHDVDALRLKALKMGEIDWCHPSLFIVFLALQRAWPLDWAYHHRLTVYYKEKLWVALVLLT